MPDFRWFSNRGLPDACNLAREGWRRPLTPFPGHGREIVLVDYPACRPIVRGSPRPAPREHRSRIILVGVDDPRCRALLLQRGYADALPSSVHRAELEYRARRALERLSMLPRKRQVGLLELDIERREAFVCSIALRLHPREFAMLWHLAELGDAGADRRELLRDVWNVRHDPETNSVAVHAFRIRERLAVHGLEQALVTGEDHRYRLLPATPEAVPGALDAALSFGDGRTKENCRDEAGFCLE